MSDLNDHRQDGMETAGLGKNVHSDTAKISGNGNGNGLKKGVEDQEQAMLMGDFLKRSVMALSALAKNESTTVRRRLADFKFLVQTGAALDEMDKSLSALKSAIAESEPPEGEIVNKENAAPAESFWGKFRKRSEPTPMDHLSSQSKDLQSIFLSMVAELDQDLGEDYSRRLAMLRKMIEQSTEVSDLVGLKDDIIAIFHSYNLIIDEERSQITDLISEIGLGLVEVERQYLNSISQTGQSHSENTKFNSLLENHLDDVKRSAQLSTTLAEFRGLVMSRLASIRTALEEKRRIEALRQESLKEEMENLNQNLNRMKKEIDQVHETRKALEKEVLIDHLTGVANRRALRERLKNELQRYQRYQHFFSLLLFDIDHFKSINDQHGHWAGDKCLKEIMKRIQPSLRETDFIARLGGDEFIIIFPGTELESAAAVAERIRKSIENTRFVYRKQEIGLTISAGVTQIQPSDISQETVINRVDKAMYKAKKKGRNMVARI